MRCVYRQNKQLQKSDPELISKERNGENGLFANLALRVVSNRFAVKAGVEKKRHSS